jgi:hypothetical protein
MQDKNLKTANKYSEKVSRFKYLGTTVTKTAFTKKLKAD